MGAPARATCYGISRRLVSGEMALGRALLDAGLHPIGVAALFSEGGAKITQARQKSRAKVEKNMRARKKASGDA